MMVAKRSLATVGFGRTRKQREAFQERRSHIRMNHRRMWQHGIRWLLAAAMGVPYRFGGMEEIGRECKKR